MKTAIDPALCTHPSFDVDGNCTRCGAKVALGVPVDFARKMSALGQGSAKLKPECPSPIPMTCASCGHTVDCHRWPNTGACCATDCGCDRMYPPVPALPVSALDPATVERALEIADGTIDGLINGIKFGLIRYAETLDGGMIGEALSRGQEGFEEFRRIRALVSPTSEGGSAGMKPGERCTRPVDHERTWRDDHEHDKATELAAPWDHGLGARCPYVEPSPQPTPEPCPECDGYCYVTSIEEGEPFQDKCPTCNGTGRSTGGER